MPVFSYPNPPFVPLTKILSADVNAKFASLSDFLNVTKLDSTNLQDGGISFSKFTTPVPGDEFKVIRVNSAATNYELANISAPTVQRLLSGSGTYTTSANCRYLRVRLIGGGGGGGSTNPSGSTGSTGGTTTFGSTLLTATGGVGGPVSGTSGGAGGTVTVNSPATAIVSLSGATGCGADATGNESTSGDGAASPFGGGGAGATGAGGAGRANTGTGGSGGGANTGNPVACAGGAGGYIEALILSPSATYAYSVGAGGAGGVVGGAGSNVGGAGGSGVILVEEFY